MVTRIALSIVVMGSLGAAESTVDQGPSKAADSAVVKEVVNMPDMLPVHVLDETKSYKIQGKSGNIFYSPGIFGLQIEPKHLGNIINVTLVDHQDGTQELDLLFNDNGQGGSRRHVISFDKDGNMIIKVVPRVVAPEAKPTP